MLCCLEGPSRYSPRDTNCVGGEGRGVAAFPGQRRFVKTGGNALAEAPPQKQSERVLVTVPNGVAPGQTIHVSAPDGSGRKVSAVVPPNATPGSQFMVEFPSASTAAVPPPAQGTPSNVSFVPNHQPPLVTSPPAKQHNDTDFMLSGSPILTASAPDQMTSSSNPYGSLSILPVPPSLNSSSPVSPPQQEQKLVQARVPPGTAPGSTIHVRIPGENRTVAAVVPPNVTEFQVAYEPSSPAPLAAASAANTSNNTTSSLPAAPPGEKLVLVRVPPGTAPGSTLHVQVPGEKNRVIAAQVPPNVTEFHVSYKA